MNANNDTLLRVEDLEMHFPIYRGVFQRKVGAVRAVDGVTGVFFGRQDENSIIEAVKQFELLGSSIKSESCRENAERFSIDQFRQR